MKNRKSYQKAFEEFLKTTVIYQSHTMLVAHYKMGALLVTRHEPVEGMLRLMQAQR